MATTDSSTPVTGPESFPDRVDDGLFGPGSVTWKLYLDPSAQLGMVAAVQLQALNPAMMRLFDKVSSHAIDPERRAELTGQFILTTTFADTVHAHAAGAAVRRMHAHAKWTDPQTGEVLEADNPEWLAWTHNTLVWGVLRAAEAFGPSLSAVEQDTFIREQFRSAELVGLSAAELPASRAELDDYIDAAQEWLALTLPAAASARPLRKPELWGNPLKTIPLVVIQDGILSLLPHWAITLYGYDGRPLSLSGARRATRAIVEVSRRLKPYDSVLRSTLAEVQAHPFRKVRVPGSATAA